MIGAAIGAMTGRRDNKQAQKQWRREEDDAEENATIAFQRQQELNEDQQAFEAQQAASAMAFEKASQDTQMSFQERMANTAHQREANDLEAAGLNRILSGTGGMGAATPVGASAKGFAGHAAGSSAPKAETPKGTVFPTSGAVMAGASTGMMLEKTMAEIEKTRAETEEVKARTPTHEASRRQIEQTIETLKSEAGYKDALTSKTPAEIEKINEEIRSIVEDVYNKRVQRGLISAETGLKTEQSKLTAVERRAMEALENADITAALKAIPALAPIAHILKPLLMKAIK